MIPALLAVFIGVFPPGSAEDPAVVAPISPTAEPVAFWWDDEAFHAGERTVPWNELGVVPTNGATFKLPMGTYEGDKVVLSATLDRSAPRLRVDSFGKFGGGTFDAKVSVRPQKDCNYRAFFGAQGQSLNYVSNFKTIPARAGVESSVRFSGSASSNGGTGCRIYEEKGERTLYHATGWYRAEGLLYDYQFVQTDRERLRMEVVSKTWTDPKSPRTYRLRVTARDLHSDEPVAWSREAGLPKGWNRKIESFFDVSDLPVGFYWMHLEYLDDTGKVVQTDRFRYLRAPEKMPWSGTTLGDDDTVPPPWTLPEFGSNGVFRCWNRSIALGGRGLVTSIVNGGKEMLLEPVDLLINGKPLDFDVALETQRVSSAVYRLKAQSAPVEVRALCDFDGYLRFSITYQPGVEGLAARIRLRRNGVCAFDDGASEDGKDYLGDGRALDRTVDLLKSHWWWAGGERGLCGGIVSLRGTHLRNLGRGLRVVADSDALTLTMNLVDERYSGPGPRTVAMYLEPTPTKPRNAAFAAMPRNKVTAWTGHLCEHFELKYPGFEDKAKFAKFGEQLKAGKRVFFYNASHARSPDDPFWGWFGNDWMSDTSAANYAHETPRPEYDRTKSGRWQYTCLNSKSCFESKLWGVNWYLNEPLPEAKDLYFDLANPRPCPNPNHGCAWTDDFGRKMHDEDFDAVRDFHKRVCRIVRAKNADGLLYGHLTRARKPTDSFFDYLTMGETLARRVSWQDSYFDIFTPEYMQANYVPRAMDAVIGVPAQFARWRSAWRPELIRTYNPREPKLDRAIRHFIAYLKIHGLTPEDNNIPQHVPVEESYASLGAVRSEWSYFRRDASPVRLSSPGPRQLWSWTTGDGRGVLVLLNDTDAAVRQTVSIEGVAGKGREVIDGTEFDFSSDSCTFDLPARTARFVKFEGMQSGPAHGYEIDLPADAKPHEVTAAGELDAYLSKISSGPVSVGGRSPAVFHVGDTKFAVDKGLGSANMDDEAWIVKSFGGDVVLNGGGPRGAIYAVAHFLEDRCGVRWWSETEERVPAPTPLKFGPLDDCGRPAFRGRDISPTKNGVESSIRYSVLNRLNCRPWGCTAEQRAKWGCGRLDVGAPVASHTFGRHIPAEKYGKDHPEWFAYSTNAAKRILNSHYAQLCLSNHEVLDKMTESVLASISADEVRSRKDGVPPPFVYDVSQNDGEQFCECENCLAIRRWKGDSGYVLDFVNSVASNVGKSHPGILIRTFAYLNTEAPPKSPVFPSENVIVRLCDTKSNIAAPYYSDDNTYFRTLVEKWGRIARRLEVWDYSITYTTGLTGLPFASESFCADALRHSLSNRVERYFFEHEAPHMADMWELKRFVEAKLLENPMLVNVSLVNRFCGEYYGAAAPMVLEYRRRLNLARERRGGRIEWFPQSIRDWDFIHGDDIDDWQSLFDAAENAVAGDGVLFARVRQARQSLDRLVSLRQIKLGIGAGPEVEAARARLRDTWRTRLESHRDLSPNVVRDLLETACGVPLPQQFKGRNVQVFTSSFLRGNSKVIAQVDDPESPFGRAKRLDASQGGNYALPFACGLYDCEKRKTLCERSFASVGWKGYKWIKIGTATIPRMSYVWFTRSWNLQLDLKRSSELAGRTFDIWASVKFTGPLFQKGGAGRSYIWIDGVVLDELGKEGNRK